MFRLCLFMFPSALNAVRNILRDNHFLGVIFSQHCNFDDRVMSVFQEIMDSQDWILALSLLERDLYRFSTFLKDIPSMISKKHVKI